MAGINPVPTVARGFSFQELAESTGSATPPIETPDSPLPSKPATAASKKTSITPPAAGGGPQLIGDLPRAEEEALRGFLEIPSNTYQNNSLGRSRQVEDSMACDCVYDHGTDEAACGDGSDCINRLTQVECLEDECRAGMHCENQRFARRQYANIEIVKTPRKGFGLRAGADLEKNAFIYEYVGEVVNNVSFVRRMRAYADEGIRHFYFMMLQKDEFIDATKKGGFGRFANHSCAPNSYVAKWNVGKRIRMGIFSNRRILKHEEITFNYNVDRYGNEAQPCYCGEANCVGFIGGKTQTDVAVLDDVYLDALGIADEVEALGLKGTKKKKSKTLDEDYVPTLKPFTEKDVPRIVQALRQTQSRKMLVKLLTRVKMTQDEPALRQLMRLRGFSVMNGLLDAFSAADEVVALVLDCMASWPLLSRNKIDDAKIEEPVSAFLTSENGTLRSLAQRLIDQWALLECAYRIPKSAPQHLRPRATVIQPHDDDAERYAKRARIDEPQLTVPLIPRSAFYDALNQPRPQPPAFVMSLINARREGSPQPLRRAMTEAEQLQAIIAQACAKEATPPPLPEEPAPQPVPRKRRRDKDKGKDRRDKEREREKEKERRAANKEKQLLKLVGGVVVQSMSRYAKQLDHDAFKRHAKEITQLIAEKEKRGKSFAADRLEALSAEKQDKIRKFVKPYMAKLLKRAGPRDSASDRTDGTGALATPPDAHPDAAAAVGWDADDAGDDAIGAAAADALYADLAKDGDDVEPGGDVDMDADDGADDGDEEDDARQPGGVGSPSNSPMRSPESANGAAVGPVEVAVR